MDTRRTSKVVHTIEKKMIIMSLKEIKTTEVHRINPNIQKDQSKFRTLRSKETRCFPQDN